MRITSEVMVGRSLERLQSRLRTYERTQSELATGHRILKPSDDPAGARRASTLNGAIKANEQHQKSTSDAKAWLDIADGQLQTAMQRLNRARDLTVRGATDLGATEREALAKEIDGIRDELEGIANTRHKGRPLFGGHGAGPAVARDPDSGVWQFDPPHDPDQPFDAVTRRISDSETIRVNTTAAEWLGAGDDNLLAQLDELAAALRSGEPISERIGGLDAAADRLGDQLATIGAATNRVTSAEARAKDLVLTLRTELSEVRDVDIAEGIMELQVQQVAYEATLAALGQALPPSLVAFLR